MVRKTLWRLKETLLGLLGLGLLGFMVVRIGPQALLAQLGSFGLLPAAGLILLYGLFQIAFALGWWVLLQRPERPVPFGSIFYAYAAGDAVNMTVPSGNLAGEPVKVALIKDRVGMEEAISSATVYKFSDISSMALFLLAGWLVHFPLFDFPALWNWGSGVVIVGMAAMCAFLYWLQRRGLYGPIGRWLHGRGLGHWIGEKLEAAHLIDDGIRRFYETNGARFLASLGFNLLAWFGGVFEIWIFLELLGLPGGFFAAFTIETFTMLVNNLIFFIPARIGVGEGSRVLLFTALGLPATAGLSYGLVRRARELCWIGAGFLLILLGKRSGPAEAV